MTTSLLRIAEASLRADPSRVIANLFLPGDAPTRARSRTAEIVDRVLALPPAIIENEAHAVLRDFGPRHLALAELLNRHVDTVVVAGERDTQVDLSREQRIVLGAAFTAEYSLEGAALCNPSAIPHPDQGGTAPEELRVAVALRAIGEGHLSSIVFASAVIGNEGWRFEPRHRPPSRSVITDGDWTREQFRAALDQSLGLGEVPAAVLRGLPPLFGSSEIEESIRRLPSQLVQRRDPHDELEVIRAVARSAYRATFDDASDLTQRALTPYSWDESHGMEDARFVRFDNGDGTYEYRATYTAYDGRAIAPRLVVSSDLRDFRIHRLVGPAAVNKGMALFPRRVGGEQLALTRTDGENLTIAASQDGLTWSGQSVVHAPAQLWEVIQTGNCGSPVETDRGWLVLVHGVGPMRTYSIGALLLDLEDPRRIVGKLDRPLLRPAGRFRDGYVPNVIYSCGAVVHGGTLWLPFGVADDRIGVGSVGLDELLDCMVGMPL